MTIVDFHTHLGSITPVFAGIDLEEQSPPPHAVMVSSQAIEDPDELLYRKRLPLQSVGFLKHAILTMLRRKQTAQGMTIPNLLNDMRVHDIARSVVLPIEYADGIERSRLLLEGCHQVAELIPFCSVHPNDPDKHQKLHTYIHMGAKGLKLHPNFQRVRPDSRESFELYETYTCYHLPLIVHSGVTGRENVFRWRRTFSAIDYLARIPENFPGLPVVFAHAGIAQYEQAIGLAQHYRNVYLEISGQPAAHIRQALAALGPERLLFGTDWPFWKQSLALHAVQQATQHDRAAAKCVLHDNAERLLRLHETA